jgi:hypothetical protein
MRLVAAAQAKGLSFTVADIFHTPRLGGLAKAVKSTEEKEGGIMPYSLLSILTCRTQGSLGQSSVEPPMIKLKIYIHAHRSRKVF